MNIKYTIKAENKEYEANLTYKLKTPKHINEIVSKSIEKGFKTPRNYIVRKLNIGDLYKMTISSFKRFEMLLDSDDTKWKKETVRNGYINESNRYNYKISSLIPYVDRSVFKFNGNEAILDSPESVLKELEQAIVNDIPNAYDVRVDSVSLYSEIDEPMQLKLNYSNDGKVYYDKYEFNESMIDLDLLFKENDLLTRSFIETSDITSFNRLTNEHFKKFDKYEFFNRKDNTIAYKISQNSIEVVIFNSYKNIPVFKKEPSITYKTFSLNAFIYNELLEKYLKDQIKLNKFMKLSYIQNSNDFLFKYLSSADVQSDVNDKEFLRVILLSDNTFKFPDNINLEPLFVEDIIKKASLSNVEKIITKLPDQLRDKIIGIKVINKIASVNANLLSKEQMNIYLDEQKREQAQIDEYNLLIGKITNSGIREKIRELNKEQLKTYKMGKDTKKWLDKNIGHNKGDEKVTIEMVNTAKRILKNAIKVSELLKDKNGRK